MNHDVEPAMLSDDLIDCCFAGLFGGNVEFDRPQIDVVVGSIRLYCLDLWSVTPVRFSHAGIYSVTCSSQRTSGECAKPTRSTGNDDNLIHDPPHAKPPFTRTTCPFTQPPSGPARNETTPAMSSGWPKRSSGDISLNSSIRASDLPLRNNSVGIGPGATALTVMLRPRNSFVSTWTNPSTPAFEAM